MKPMEVEILVAEVGAQPGDDQLFHILFEGTVSDESGYTVLGGEAEAIAERLSTSYRDGLDLAGAVQAAREALAGPDRTLSAADLEVAALARENGRRAFYRIEDDELDALLGD
jgi:proteasome alpha subunit